MKCYICNKDLKLKGTVQDLTKESETHEEHIIHNALRGKISSRVILCASCGNDLNDSIDSSFVKYFAPITEQLRYFLLKKDHGAKNAPTSVLGQMLLSEFPEMDVFYRDGVVSSHKPIHHIDWDNKTVTIFGNDKTIGGYEKKVIGEITEAGGQYENFKVERITNMVDGVFVPYFGNGFANLTEAMSLGYIKMAVEFALASGIAREDLNRALTIDGNGKGSILLDRNIVTFLPQGAIDRVYEYYKPLLEPNYPTHTLILFTHERGNGRQVLYCYIELFSTFQVYVILNHSFDRPFYRSYYQPVFKEELLMDTATSNLEDTLRNIHKRLEKIYNMEEELDEIETKIAGGISSLPYDLPEILDAEMDAIENIIMNQNIHKPDFLDRSSYDLSVVYKRYFHSPVGEDCESMPGWLTKSSIYVNEQTQEFDQNYTMQKIGKLVYAIIALKNLSAE